MQSSHPSLEIFRQGLLAHALGAPLWTNPYEVDSIEYLLWEEGWRGADKASEGEKIRALPAHKAPRSETA
jgi:hypothetical protein